jgi:hypothetical protein
MSQALTDAAEQMMAACDAYTAAMQELDFRKGTPTGEDPPGALAMCIDGKGDLVARATGSPECWAQMLVTVAQLNKDFALALGVAFVTLSPPEDG